MCAQYGGFGRHFMPWERILANKGCVCPSLVLALQAGMRWVAVGADLRISYQYGGLQCEEELRYVLPMQAVGASHRVPHLVHMQPQGFQEAWATLDELAPLVEWLKQV